jgi:class 3 adenylate cyclase/tetratricopeptide (TPR) repeat protein
MLRGMVTCARCGTESPDGFKFCPGCGAPLGVAPAPVPEERKVVSALFCDLVGFTATSDGADPEDVDRMLTGYFAVARAQIEAHGGVVEKFIGDAVLGVFGVPAAHEDDPERAVRAALRICEDAAGLRTFGGTPLRLRVGINTGEVLVRLGVAPGSGERFLAGDTINTASRIQSVAPEMGVAVGLPTYEATKAVFGYDELPPAALKGIAEPVRVFQPTASRARLGVDITRSHGGPFIGREIDLALLRGLFDKSVSADAVGLVTVVGEPGLGKSRLVAELFSYVDARPGLVTWRQGRCLPYGEGITFWALGEIVKAHAGILESDPAEVASAKLEVVLPNGDERPWFRQRLLPLLGIEATSAPTREELFTAWRRFLEHLAESRPTVLVFEDLHWADEALLAFLEHLADRVEGVPLLVVGTARPELFEHHPLFVGNRINLTPLSESETSRLVAGLLGAAVPPKLEQPILERAEGNPLYAEEFVRLLRDRDLLVDSVDGTIALRPGAEVPLPDSIGALLAARLDTLPPERKSMLADAAVIGKVFWSGAVAAMGDRDVTEVTDALRELSHKELVRPARRSSIEGEAEYAFWHVLARDVAYGSLPRAARAARHVAAARWIESRTPDRLEDVADILAYHYGTALELARAAGERALAADLEAKAFRFLTLAGERALGLDTAAALASLERALELAPTGHPEHAPALLRFGRAAFNSGRYADAAASLEEAIPIFRANADLPGASRALGILANTRFRLGDPRWAALPGEALELLEPLGPSPDLAAALGEVARAEALNGRNESAIRSADRALETAEDLGLPRPARALGYRGMARAGGGDPGGLEDLREAIALAAEAGQGREVALLRNNLAAIITAFEGPAARVAMAREGLAYARARGLAESVDTLTIHALAPELGELDEALAGLAELAPRVEARGDIWVLVQLRASEAQILALRGQAPRIMAGLDWLESTAREIDDLQGTLLGLGYAAVARASLGQSAAAAALLSEVDAFRIKRDPLSMMDPELVRTAATIGDQALAERLAASEPPRYPLEAVEHDTISAILAEARGDLTVAVPAYSDAAGRWERFGDVIEQAFALLGEGRCLVALSRAAEASPALRQAQEIFEELGAAPALAETNALLATFELSAESPRQRRNGFRSV